jgi:hypothetical protein
MLCQDNFVQRKVRGIVLTQIHLLPSNHTTKPGVVSRIHALTIPLMKAD